MDCAVRLPSIKYQYTPGLAELGGFIKPDLSITTVRAPFFILLKCLLQLYRHNIKQRDNRLAEKVFFF